MVFSEPLEKELYADMTCGQDLTWVFSDAQGYQIVDQTQILTVVICMKY